MATILIYEPDEVLAHKLCDSLKKENVRIVSNCGNESLATLDEDGTPPVILLDARLKWTDCRPLLQRFEQLGCPILFMTQDRKMSAHLRALYSGRSEVLTLPYTQKALRGKLSLLMEQTDAPLVLRLDEDERVAHLDGRRVELTAQEYALLLALMEKPDTPVSREQLLRKAWGYQSMGETRTVDVHVQRLRKKLGSDYIETVYKCGYRLQGLTPQFSA